MYPATNMLFPKKHHMLMSIALPERHGSIANAVAGCLKKP